MSQTVGEVLRQAIGCLERHGVSEPQASAEVLLADVLATTRPILYIDAAAPLSTAQYSMYTAALQRRLQGEPVQYITGRQEFWSLEFVVSPQVLIPRPESELLVEHGVQFIQQWCTDHPHQRCMILEVGTGSGNLAISLAHELPQAQVWAVDRSYGALQVARQNAERLGVGAQLHWVCSDLVTALHNTAPLFALCVANLPYVATAEWQALPRDIKAYEPAGALCGGNDGLDLIRQLITTSPALLASGGRLLLEVGLQQGVAVQEFIQQQDQWAISGVSHDFAGIARMVWAQAC